MKLLLTLLGIFFASGCAPDVTPVLNEVDGAPVTSKDGKWVTRNIGMQGVVTLRHESGACFLIVGRSVQGVAVTQAPPEVCKER